MENDTLTQFQIRDDSIIIYNQYQGPTQKKERESFMTPDMKEVRKKAYSGQLSAGARKRMKKAATLMTQIVPTRTVFNDVTRRYQKIKLTFITLTISDNSKNYTSKEAYTDVLKPFLQWLSKTLKNKLYLWKAELQKRGQIHYHILISSFIHYQLIRDKWNYLQMKAGYLEKWHEEHNNYDPNSTDIHSLKKIKNVKSYILKYMLKDPDSRSEKEQKDPEKQVKFDGKVWDCSKILKTRNYYTMEEPIYLPNVIKQYEIEGKIYRKEIDYATILICIKIKPYEMMSLPERMDYETWKRQFWAEACEPPNEQKAA